MKRCIPWMFLAIAFFSCAKQGDDTANGPKAKITIINAALDSDPVTLILDGQNVNEAPIPFGEVSGNADDAYINAHPGVQNTLWQVGTTPPSPQKFYQWAAGTHYTLVQYDTAVGNVAPLILVTDNLSVNDTMAKGRFINCVAGNDSLSIWLVGSKDTVVVASNYAYLGKSGSFPSSFSATWKPGSRRLELVSKQGVVLFSEEMDFVENLDYSFVAFGETSGTGIKAPRVRKLVQLK